MVEKITVLKDSDAWRIRRAAADAYDEIKELIATGQADFFDLAGCALVTRREGLEVVVVCAEGENIDEAAALIADMSRQAGYKTLRFHTARRGLPRLLKKLNPREVERVYRVDLINGKP